MSKFNLTLLSKSKIAPNIPVTQQSVKLPAR